MEKIRDYLTSPATWISFLVFVFGIGAVWGTLNSRISQIEKVQNEMDIASIQSQLSAIQTDLQWIKYQLQR